MRSTASLGGLLLAFALLSCGAGEAQPGPSPSIEPTGPETPGFLSGDTAAVLMLMDSMTMRQRAAQLLMLPLYSKPGETGSFGRVKAALSTHEIGGVIAMQGDREGTRRNLNELDSLSRALTGIGLLTAMDAEWGSSMRLPDGRAFPKAMALGATMDAGLVQEAGRAAGQELRELGVNIDFAPVADVNSNPANPVIGNRSFGSNPENVGALASAWAKGLRSAGVMAVGKHFPGHGDADLDSHHALPLILSDSAHLADIELPPFRTLIDDGVEGIMTAHLDVPSMDSTTGLPTSLSPRVIQDILIDSLGFRGLVFTDALTMAGAAGPVPPGKREVAALLAGNDILLFPSDANLVLDSIESALSRGVLDSARVNDACMKVLLAKLWNDRPLEAGSNEMDMASLQRRIREAMLVRMGQGKLLDPAANTGLLIVGNRGRAMEERLKLSFPDLKVVRLGKGSLDAGVRSNAIRRLSGCDQVVLAFLNESNRPSSRFGIPRGAEALVEAFISGEQATFISLFTSPYALQHLPDSREPEWMIAHHEDDETQIAAMAAWCGEGGAMGRLPVDVGRWMSGEGNPRGRCRLPRVEPNPDFARMGERMDSLSLAAINLAATPGMRIMVVVDDTIRYDGCHGHLGDDARTAVERHHVYDLASITKVAATTTLVMMSVEKGLFSLDQPLSQLLPPIENAPLNPDLGRRTLRDILAHRAGLPAWIPFYLDVVAHEDSVGGDFSPEPREGWIPICNGRCMRPEWCDSIRTTVRSIQPNPPGSYRYSDLGYYLIQDLLESAWDLPLDLLADSLIYRPLELNRIGYRPLDWAVLEDVAPTEVDTLLRNGHIRGTVHDQGAAMMGGVAGHAGLFSDAHDLAVLMETMRTGGSWMGHPLIDASTLAGFTTRAFPQEQNRRALGWDKPGINPDSGASGNAGSWSSFGHSGFTGTLTWTDPERGWTVVILGNRICPDAANRTYIREDIRTKALMIVEDALGHTSRFSTDQDTESKRP